ncbi:anti-sigma factor [Peteryoungia desertarenae]|uniref:Anti-sigma factor n=1 Tax=Peteryoungia desertarenae TaxID=1813451 RepID=A0ABX6QLI8_9HYPH|nr:anti-sigma factor [Peteryoungia desertarenae]QLF69404.1 anti-sigma factor [Peteryoungia desertarenae]
MSTSHTLSERTDAYVLGLMDDDESRAVEREMEHNESLVRAVADSRDRFLELDLVGPTSPVSADLWARIERQLGPQQRPGRAAVQPTAANDNGLSWWRKFGLSAAAAVMLLVGALSYTLVSRTEPQVIAILMNAEGEPVVMIEDFGNDTAKVTPLIDIAVADDRSLQLWTLPSADVGPVSLGVLDDWRTATVRGPDLPIPIEEQLYEITVEPLGGSPTGKPTGPIIGKGFAKAPRP